MIYEREVSEYLEGIRSKIKKFKRVLEEGEVDVKNKEEMIGHSGEEKEKDLNFIEKTINNLGEMQFKAFTNVLIERELRKQLMNLILREKYQKRLKYVRMS